MKYVFFTFIASLLACTCNAKDNTMLTRRKRYLSFPDGASFAVAYCVGSRSPIMSGIWSEGVGWAVAYDLPNDTSIFEEDFSPKYLIKRRHRRDLYNKIEIVINSMGFDGRSCIYRTLCEASQRFVAKRNDIFEEILRLIFRFPQQKILDSEPDDHRLYHWAYRLGRENQGKNCEAMFPTCSISLLDIMLDYLDFNNENNLQPD